VETLSKAVVDQSLHHWSPSQVVKFSRCRRKWWFSKVAGLPEEGSDATDLGKAVHSCLENWYRSNCIVCTENDPPIREDLVERAVELATFAVGTGQLPPRTGRLLLTEEPLAFDLAGIPVEGYVDLVDLTQPGRIVIWDYKTRSRFTRSGKYRNILTAEDLAADVQMVTYAAALHRKYGAQSYQLGHIYLRTTGKPALEFSELAVITPAQFAAVLRPLEETIREMDRHAGMNVADVEPNYDACHDYRRPCPYIAQCMASCGRFTPPEHMQEELSTMSISEKIAAHRAAGAAVKVTTSVTPDAVSVTPPPAQPTQPVVATSSTPAPTPTTSTGTAAAAEYRAELTVYVDCQPTKGSGVAVRLEDEIAARTKRILGDVAAGRLRVENLSAAAATSVVDLREVKYGCGTTALVADFKRNPPTGLVVARNTGLAALVLEVLLPVATKVVEPLR
jgi:RecB family exonuclease